MLSNLVLRRRPPRTATLVFLLWVVVAIEPLSAQPSGGPYGPIPQNYSLPDAVRVYYVAPDGRADASGATLAEPTTLESAIARVVTGDALVLRGGIYRTGGLVLNQGITMQPYAEERPVLKGTLVATDWEPLRNHVWRTRWSHLFPATPLGWWRREREGMVTPLHRFNNDMVFVDGELLQSAGWEGELDQRSFYIDYDSGYVYIGTDPTNRLVEITAFDCALLRTSRSAHGKESDRKGPVIRGLTFTQYAYRAIDIEGKRPAATVSEEPTDDPVGPADPSTFGKEVVGTTLEHVTISYCSRVAGYFRGDGLTIRHSLVSDTSTEGLYVIGSSDVLLEKNIIRRNNIEQLTGYYPAGVKIFNQSQRVTVRDNLVIDQPHSNGVWYDVGTADAVFVNNWVEGAIDGFFFEISKGAVVAGNVFINCERGIRVLNSANARVYHNTLVNAPVTFERNERSAAGDHFGWHPRTGPDVDQRERHAFVGNLLVGTESFDQPLLRLDQPQTLCDRLGKPQVTELDANVYIRQNTSPQPLLLWSPMAGEKCQVGFGSVGDLRKLSSGFERHGRSFTGFAGTLFKSPELRKFELVRLPPDVQPVAGVPADVRRLLGWTGESSIPGAFPFRAASLAGPRGAGAMTTARGTNAQVVAAPFGALPDGKPVEQYRFSNSSGIRVTVLTYGAIISSLETQDRQGRLEDIVLGFSDLDGYVRNKGYFGAVVGRYGNRIANARFTLDGRTYALAANNGPNHLHGGLVGFDKRVWAARSFQNDTGVGVTLSLTSPDGEEGYPGTLHATVTYTLTEADTLIVDYQVTTDRATPQNLTQHSYFNLAGGRRDILSHVLTLNASHYTPVDATLIPTGEITTVANTPFDFRAPMTIGARIGASDVQLGRAGGYDHNFVLDRSDGGLAKLATIYEPESGRTLDVSTTEPGAQFYSGNFLDGTATGKGGIVYQQRWGFCLETQHFPDSPNQAGFPSTILRPGDTYRSRTVYAFGVRRWQQR